MFRLVVVLRASRQLQDDRRNRSGTRPGPGRSRHRGARLAAIALTLGLSIPATLVGASSAPPPPTLLLAQGLTDTTAELTWSAVPGATQYAVYRGGSRVAILAGTLYDDLGRTPGTSYSYQVTDTVGGIESPPTSSVSATTQTAHDSTPPTQPGVISVSGLSASGATLSWPGSKDNVGLEGYLVFRGPGGASPASMVQIAPVENGTTYKATSLKAKTAYRFGIVAQDAAQNHSAMRTVTFTTPTSSNTSVPAAPTSSGLKVTPFSSSRIDVAWGTSKSTNAIGYQVFRDGVQVVEVDSPRLRFYSDNGLMPSTTHSYAVRAVSLTGVVSPLTAPRSATTTAAGAVLITRGPYVQWTGPTFTRVAWWTNVASASTVNYGTGGTLTQQVTDPTPRLEHVMLLAGLNAGTAYNYQVSSGGTTSSTLTVNTAAPPGSTYNFSVVGDYGGDSPGEFQNAGLMAGESTQFVVTLGDNVYPYWADPDSTTAYTAIDARMYKPFSSVFGSRPVWFGASNHEYYGDASFWQHAWLPNNEHWYSFNWGDAHILVLDTQQTFATGTPQYQFAQADLAANQSAKWRIVMSGRPGYSSSGAHSSSVPVQKNLVPLFQQQNVQLVLSGNSHNYERSYPLVNGAKVTSGGVTWVVSGGGGNGLNKFSGSRPAWSAYRNAIYEHVVVSVSPSGLTIQAISAASGALLDTVTIN